MQWRMLKDTINFAIHNFKIVKEQDLHADDSLVYLNLKYFGIIEEIIEEAGGVHKGKKVNFKTIIKMLQDKFELFPLLKAQLFYNVDESLKNKNFKQGSNTQEEWDHIKERLKIYKLCKQVFHSRSVKKEADGDTPEFYEIDIKEVASLIAELRLKINVIMAGDYMDNKETIKYANILQLIDNGEYKKVKAKDMKNMKMMQKVERILLEDFTLIVDKA